MPKSNIPDENLYSSNEIKTFCNTSSSLFVDGEWVAVDANFSPWMKKYNIQEIKIQS